MGPAGLARAALGLARGAGRGARGVGDMPFKPNPSIEKWGAMREAVEEQFKCESPSPLPPPPFLAPALTPLRPGSSPSWGSAASRRGEPRARAGGGQS